MSAYNDLNLEFTLEKMKKVISNKYGLIKDVKEIRRQGDRGKLFINSTVVSKIDNIYGFFNKELIAGGGASIKKYQSIISSIGETIERYSALFTVYFKDKIIFDKTYNELENLGILALELEKLNLYTDFQYNQKEFKIKPFTRNSRIDWIEGIRLYDDKPIMVPIGLVVYSIMNNKNLIDATTSSGLACGSSREQAILTGLFEIIERDSFSFAWWTKTSFPIIDANSILKSKKLKSFYNEFNDEINKIKIVYSTTDLDIPVFLSVYRGKNENNEPATLVTASCNIDPIKAIEKAVTETLCSLFFIRKNLHKHLSFECNNYDLDINSFEDHLNFHLKDSNKYISSFLDNSKELISLDNIKNESKDNLKIDLNFAIKKLHAKGYDPISIDLTTRDIKNCDLHVYRTIIPGLLQINGAHLYRHLGGERLYELKQNLGHADKRLKDEDINHFPHPFP